MKYLVVGYGNIGAKRKAVLGDRCVATADPFNAAADYRTASECPDAWYDAAVLAVPNEPKIELLEYFLEHGKHVLVEKPLIFPEPDVALRLARLAAARGAVWYTSYNFRFEPNVVAMKRHIDDGAIGAVYRARLFYGNGTAGTIAGTWRDTPLGVLEDLASHLIDLTGFVLGKPGTDFVVWARHAHELKGADHCILATADRTVVIEVSFLSWKNRWRLEVIGDRGSLEMDGLTKWGPSRLTIRERQLPSGPPVEREEVASPPDSTWAADVAHFEAQARAGRTSCENDLWISRTVLAAAHAPVEAGR